MNESNGSVRRLAALMAAASVLLTSCGGGGGSATGDGAAGGGTPTELAGQVLVLGVNGAPVAAPSAVSIELRALAADGGLGAVSASTTSASDGRFTLRAPAGVPPGSAWVVQATTDAGALRAWVAGASVRVSPASEAVYQELAEASRNRGALPAAEPARLARFVNAATQFLELTDVHASGLPAAVTELRAWMGLDPATATALTSLRASGQLPASLGDIGGLFGAGNAAWTSRDDAGDFRQHVMRYRADNGGEFDYWGSRPGDAVEWDAGPPDVVYRMVDDGLRLEYWTVPRLPPLDDQIGLVRIASYGTALGDSERLASFQRKTTGLSFDADQIEDDFLYTSDQQLVGVEPLSHANRTLRALKVRRVETIVVTLSSGGTIRLELVTTSWHVPFGGALRATTTATAVNASGASVSASSDVQLERGVLNGMSWPGGVHLSSRQIDLPLPSSGPVLVPFIAPDARHLVYAKRTHVTGGELHGLQVMDPQTGALTAAITLSDPVIRAAPDAQSVFLAVHASGFSSLSSVNGVQDMPLDQAQALSARILRIDARTLATLRDVQLPAAPSAFLPGRGFPRYRVESLQVSAADSQSFVATSGGMLRYDAVSDQPAILAAPDSEQFYWTVASFKLNQAHVYAWDDVRNELYFRYEPFWFNALPPPGHYRVGADDAGMTLAGMLPTGQAPWPAQEALFDDDAVSLVGAAGNAYSSTLSRYRRDGTLLANVARPGAACTLRIAGPMCFNGSLLERYNAQTLVIVQSLDLQWDLRWRAHQDSTSMLSLVGALAPGVLLASTPSYGTYSGQRVQVGQLRLPR